MRKSQKKEDVMGKLRNSFGIGLLPLIFAVLALVACTPDPAPAAPEAPAGLSAGNPTATSLDVSWNSVPDATSYELFRASSASGPWTTQAHAGSETSWTDSGLEPETTYYYEVRAVNQVGPSPLSASASATTASAAPLPVPDVPTGLSVGNPRPSRLDISWNGVSGATGYELFRAGSASGPWTSQVHSGSGTSWTDSGLAPETAYHYAVRAVNGSGASPLSASATATTAAQGSWRTLSLTGIPSTVATKVIWIDLHQASASGPLALVIGATPPAGSGQNVYAFTGDDGAWTDISEASPPRLNANSGSLVSAISPAGEPCYWYQGPDLPLGESRMRIYSGGSWADRGNSPAPRTSVGEYRNLFFSPGGAARMIYQTAQWDNPNSRYLQRVYLREYSSGWAAPALMPDPLVAHGTSTFQNPSVRAAIGPSGDIHIVLISTADNASFSAAYYHWNGTALAGPETIASTNKDSALAIAVNPQSGQPYVLMEDVSTEDQLPISAYRRADSGWTLVGAAGSLSRTTFNNDSADLEFSADGTLWATTQTSSAAFTAFRYDSAWTQSTWTAGSASYEGMSLLPDGRLCLFAKPSLSGQPILIGCLDSW
jgi:hypothetical protein